MDKICKSFWTCLFEAAPKANFKELERIYKVEINIESPDENFPMADALEEALADARSHGVKVTVNDFILKNSVKLSFDQYTRVRALRNLRE